MKTALVVLALALAAGCGVASGELTAEDPFVAADDPGSDGAEDASAPSVFDATMATVDVDASACAPPPGVQRTYVGTPTQCVELFVTCVAGEVTFANACGCGCER